MNPEERERLRERWRSMTPEERASYLDGTPQTETIP
jgi:hypothetical protein